MDVARHQRGLELVRIGGAAGTSQILSELGVNPAPIISVAGLSPEVLADPESVITFQVLANLLERCAAVTGSDSFGLLVGKCCSAPSLGIVGLLVEHSPNVRSALHSLVRHFHIQDSRGVPILRIAPSTLRLVTPCSESRIRACTISSIRSSRPNSTSCANSAAPLGGRSKSCCRGRGRRASKCSKGRPDHARSRCPMADLCDAAASRRDLLQETAQHILRGKSGRSFQ